MSLRPDLAAIADMIRPGARRMNPEKLTSSYLGPNLFAQGAIFLLKKN